MRGPPVVQKKREGLESVSAQLNSQIISRMYPACKVDISQHLAIHEFPQSDHTVCNPSADTGSLCSEAKQTSSNISLPFALITGSCKRTQLAKRGILNISIQPLLVWQCKLNAGLQQSLHVLCQSIKLLFIARIYNFVKSMASVLHWLAT